MQQTLKYPAARRGDDVDDHHGAPVADPYRWLEDADSPETAAFVAAQNELTGSFLASVASRAAIRRRLTELWEYPRYSVPFERGGRWFQFRNPGLANQATLYVMAAPDEPGAVLLDPNSLSPDGTVAVTSAEVSPDGRLLAYALSSSGSDWQTWRVRDVESREDLPDVIEWSKFGGLGWLKDGSGFYYGAPERPEAGTEYVAAARHPRLLFHKLGTEQAEDALFFEAPDEPEWLPYVSVTHDGRYIVVSIARGTRPEHQIHVFDLEAPDVGFRLLVGDFSALVYLVSNLGPVFYLLTDAGAERRRIVAVDLEAPDRHNWREIVPESSDTLTAAERCGETLVCEYLSDAHARLRVFDLEGGFAHDVPLEGMVSLQDAEGGEQAVRGSPESNTIHFKTVSFTESGSIWSHDTSAGLTRLVRASASPFDAGGFVTELAFATSDDGTRVPLFVSRRRDLQPTGEVPVLLHGYGGFNVPSTPTFRTAVAVWMERGGVYG